MGIMKQFHKICPFWLIHRLYLVLQSTFRCPVLTWSLSWVTVMLCIVCCIVRLVETCIILKNGNCLQFKTPLYWAGEIKILGETKATFIINPWMRMNGVKMGRKPVCRQVGEDRKPCPFFTEEQNTNSFVTWKGNVDLAPLAANSFAYWVPGGCYNVDITL